MLPRKEVKLPSGEVVLVRSLSRYEIHEMTAYADGDSYKGEVFLVAKGRDWSYEQADQWLREVSAAEPQPVIEGVTELSGLDDGPKG